ncbi:MAG: hypothetical protein ABSD74_18855 [Rhizomicrobium sp.]|jgi:hypothetical protein
MTIKSFFRCSSATVAVGAALLLAGPAVAQTAGDGYGQPAQPYGPPPAQEQNSQPAQEQYGPPPAQQQYDQQMQQYRQQQQDYRAQRQQYESSDAQYRANLRAYDRATYDWSYPAAVGYEYDGARLWPVSRLADPRQQLFEAPIEGPGGRWVGRVRNVEPGPTGLRIEVALNRRVSVWVGEGDLRFDAHDHVLFTDLTRDELWQMPGATVESGPM